MRVLLAWELGANLGHLGPLSEATKVLIDRGHEVWLGFWDLNQVHRWFDLDRVHVVALPRPVARPPEDAPRTWSDLVWPFGFFDADALANHLRAWDTLRAQVAPDAVVLNSAPMSMLGTLGTGLRRVGFDLGWSLPPHETPLPAMRPGVDLDDRETADGRLVEVVRAAQSRLGRPPIDRVADMFDLDAALIHTFPELDPYENRVGAEHVGPAFAPSTGVSPRWPPGDGRRVFAYLRPEYTRFAEVIGALARSGASVLVFAPGHSGSAPPNLRFLPGPARLSEVFAQCDLAVCHSMVGVGAAALLAGVPVLSAPRYMEQQATSFRARSQGLATELDPGPGPIDANAVVARALSSRPRRHARKFAKRYADFDPTAPYRRLAEVLK